MIYESLISKQEYESLFILKEIQLVLERITLLYSMGNIYLYLVDAIRIIKFLMIFIELV